MVAGSMGKTGIFHRGWGFGGSTCFSERLLE